MKNKRYTIIVNRNASFVLRYGEEPLREKIGDVFRDRLAAVHFVHARSIPALFKQVDPETALLVGGGDGTIHLAANRLMKSGIPFGVLPFGTMNLFARDIGLAADPLAVMTDYLDIRKRVIDTVQGNGRVFLCNAMIGVDPALIEEREKARNTSRWYYWPVFLAQLLAGFLHPEKRRLTLSYDNGVDVVNIQALIVSNNSYVKDPESSGDRLKKNSLTDGRLAIYAVDTESPAESLALLARLIAGRWQADPSVQSFETKRLVVFDGKKKLDVTLDGELYAMKTPVKFAIIPKSLELWIPVTATERSTPP